MEERAEYTLTRQKLADYLEEMAQGFRQGQMQVKGDTWQESLKTLKKRMGSQFKELQGAVSQGKFPDPQTLATFVADSQAMAKMAEPEWEEAMQAYLEHLAALERAVASRDLEAARHEVADLRTAMVTCHREFK
jgi:XXXCH domain-containing protein